MSDAMSNVGSDHQQGLSDLACAPGAANHAKDCVTVYARKLLPGVVIFVHGVNSDGEWYEATERGLCDGLNARLAREPADVAHPEHVGRLASASYASELTPRGFIDDKLTDETFVAGDEASPVIRFRWGYRLGKSDKSVWETNLPLDEKEAWGGGPFANGCSALADCWSAGLSDAFFFWWIADDLNPERGRTFFAMPPRHYYAHAAWRLATLVAEIRRLQPAVPVTIIGHSQGTMIAMASAFVGESQLAGRGVADSYQLFNSPYNLTLEGVPRLVEAHAARNTGGRVTEAARRETFRRFLAIVRKRRALRQSEDLFDRYCGNARPVDGSPACTAAGERALGRDNRGTVTVHCNPADQLISVTTLQGIGWRGVTDRERSAVGGADVLRLRVWADGRTSDGAPWRVGTGGCRPYHYWRNHWRPIAWTGARSFWHPPAKAMAWRFRAAWDDPGRQFGRKVGAIVQGIVLTPFEIVGATFDLLRVNASPPAEHMVTDDGPEVPEPIVPRACDGGRFDHGRDRPHEALAADDLLADPNDPYNRARRELVPRLRERVRGDPDADDAGPPKSGDAASEAQLRYEHNAQVRMAARRDALGKADPEAATTLRRMADRYDGKDPEADRFMAEHYDAKRAEYLAAGMNSNSPDHSTILANPLHAEKVIAYDLALGYARITPEDWRRLRKIADWRWVPLAKDGGGESAEFKSYYKEGKVGGRELGAIEDYGPAGILRTGIDGTRERSSDVLADDGMRSPGRRSDTSDRR